MIHLQVTIQKDKQFITADFACKPDIQPSDMIKKTLGRGKDITGWMITDTKVLKNKLGL